MKPNVVGGLPVPPHVAKALMEKQSYHVTEQWERIPDPLHPDNPLLTRTRLVERAVMEMGEGVPR